MYFIANVKWTLIIIIFTISIINIIILSFGFVCVNIIIGKNNEN